MRKYPIVVIGAGAGGLVIAIGATRAGKKVLLVEKGHYGGDCTNFGCIPSKSLIASGEDRKLYAQKKGALERVRGIVSEVRSHEDPEALAKMGVETLTGKAVFLDSHHIQVGEEVIEGEKFVIATGSSPLIPSVEGLDKTSYLTNETIFDLPGIPKTLTVLGGGPIGCELAQAFQKLGTQVALVHRHTYLLKKEEPEAQGRIKEAFKKEGIDLYLGPSPKSVSEQGGKITLLLDSGKEIVSDHLLVSIGRRPNVEMGLEAAHVSCSKKGIEVDKYGRTSQKHIFAIGDVTGGPQFTHAAENQGRAVLTSLLLPVKKKISTQAMPRTTYTDPEVASFGPKQAEAEEKYGKENLAIYFVPLSENDRAVTTGRTEGFVKVITKKLSSKIVGATIVAPRAGEMLPELSLAAKEKIPLRRIGDLIHPYPTYNLAIRKAADLWLIQTFLPWLRKPAKWINWKRWIPLAVIVLLMIIAYSFDVHKYFTFEMLKERHGQLKGWVTSSPVVAPIVFTLIYTLATSLSLPGGAILSLLGGFLFPIPWSTLYVVIGATIGASVIFLAARTAFGDLLRKKTGKFIQKMEKGFQENTWSYLLFLRFIPLFPFWVVNIAPAFFNVAFSTYVWTTFVGIIPGAYVYTQAGAGFSAIFTSGGSFSIDTIFNVQVRIALVALAVFSLVPIFVKKWIHRKKR
ncbi:MAG: Mercuric reductase [Chlamydiae bacterium]|nr:Mercuric reductase [Chlamydiota bacterium]